LPRPSARDEELAEPDEAESEFDPVDPPDPVVSAKATGIAPAAEPTPRISASAPTRPT
jgi:hypothetical protein